MKKWRTLALVGTSQEAAYYNLGAFAQSSRRGITKASDQFGSILCRVNSWLSMLFPLGTWSSLCISHNELLKLHQDLTNAPGTLNYTVSLGDFSGGGLLLESPSGALRLPLPTSGEMKHFAICDTKSIPLAFDGTLWHGTEEFAGDRWVVTAYTSRHLEELSAEDVARLRGWSFPLPSIGHSEERRPEEAPLPSPQQFALIVDSSTECPLSDNFCDTGIPHVVFNSFSCATNCDAVFRAASSGVFPFIVAVLSSEMTLEHLTWALRLIQVAVAVGASVLLDISVWTSCWSNRIFVHCVSTSLHYIIQVPPCAFQGSCGVPWVLVSSSQAFSSLGQLCQHRKCRSHGYPGRFRPALRASICRIVKGFDVPSYRGSSPLTLAHIRNCVPGKDVEAPPHARVDGGGLFSQPDWSRPERPKADVLKALRHELMSFCSSRRIPFRLREHVKCHSDEPLFSVDETGEMRAMTSRWFASIGETNIDWSIPDGQPYALHALARLSGFLQDVDDTLFNCLLQGVPTGVRHDIPPSHCMAASLKEADNDDLQVCASNWQGAEDDPALLDSLVQKEIDRGWLHPCPSLEEAKRRFPLVAVGKMNIVHSEGRDPRLVIDSSICGTNGACYIPEKSALPTLHSIQASWPLRGRGSSFAAWSLDVQAAHKSIRIRPCEQGLLGVRIGNRFFFYSVCPFGATFSAYWFARLGAFFTRCLRLLIYIAHFLALYVDDLLGFQCASVAEMSFCITLAFCSIFGIPLSWKKLQFGVSITWIGWQLDFAKGCVCIPQDKLDRLHRLLSEALRRKHTDRVTLSKVCGVLQWLFKLFPLARPWLRALYLDLHSPRATNFSVRQNEWQRLVECVSNTLYVVKVPEGSALSLGSRILSVRHRKVATKSELLRCSLGDKDIWLRISDPASKKRTLSSSSRELLHYWMNWSALPPVWRPLQQLQHVQVEAAADAMAQGDIFAIGGYISLAGSDYWFSEKFCIGDFAFAELPLRSDASKDITSYEALAQIALVWLLGHLHPLARMAVRLHSWCDNTGAEASSNSLFTTAWPLAAFTQRLALMSSFTGVHLDVHHIAGPKNSDADHLSRWVPPAPLAARWLQANRRRVSLRQLWFASPNVSLCPPSWRPSFPVPFSSPMGAAL